MAYLLLRSSKPARGGLINGRVLIGRWSIHAIFIDDQTVSRIHAWIVPQGNQYFITDGGSFNGTTVNGRRIGTRHLLKNGDDIRVGPEEITFYEGDSLPPRVQPIDLTPRDITHLGLKGGFLVDCPCGAPLLVKDALRGKHGRCRFCGNNHLLLSASQQEEIKAVLDFDEADSKSGSRKKLCSVCQGAIADLDAITRCPTCNLAFHTECWTDNRGCSAYGCPQVGTLDAVLDEAHE